MTWDAVFEQVFEWTQDLHRPQSPGLPHALRRIRAVPSYVKRLAEIEEVMAEDLVAALRHLFRHQRWPDEMPEGLRWLLYLRLDFALCRVRNFAASGFECPASASEWLSRVVLRGWPEWRQDAFRLAAVEHLLGDAGAPPGPLPPLWLT